MDMNQLVIMSLVFLAVILAIWSVRNMFSDSNSKDTEELPLLFRVMSPGIYLFSAEFGPILEKQMPKHSEKLRLTLRKSALPLTVGDVYGASIFFAFCGAVFGVISAFGMPIDNMARGLFILIFLMLGLMYPETYISKLAAKRMDEFMSVLPFSIDLISSSMNAGLDFGSAVRYLVDTGKDNLLKKEFRVYLREIELGKTRSDALIAMQERICSPEFTRFIAAISFGIESGTSIIEIMRIQSEEMRRVKFAKAEQQAAKVTTKMFVPMLIFIFPSMFIMIFVPIFLKVKDSGLMNLLNLNH